MGKKRRLILKISVIVLSFFIVFIAFIYLAGPSILKSILIKNISKTIQREVSIERIELNPFYLTIKVSNINVKEKNKKDIMFSLEELFINAELSSIYQRALILKEITLKKPYINIIRNTDGSYNFSDLMAIKEKEKEVEPKKIKKVKKRPFYFSIQNITITNGSIDFYDGPFKTAHTIRELNLKIPFISNFAHHVDKIVTPQFSAKINDDFYEIIGEAKPFAEPKEANININIQDLDIPKYISYLPVKLNFKLPSGSLDVAAKLSFIDSKDKPPYISISSNIIMRELAGNDLQNKPIFKFPETEINITSIEPLNKNIEISKVLIKSPVVYIKREEDKTLNLFKLIGEKKVEKDKPSKKEAGESKDRIKEREEKKETDVALTINEVMIEKGGLSFNDLTTTQPVHIALKNLNLKAQNLSSKKDNKSNLLLSFAIENSGEITLNGSFKIDPVSADLDVNIKNIVIDTFQPYFTDRVNINITDGTISTTGKATFHMDEKNTPSIKYTGNLLVSNLQSIDKLNGEPLLNWKAFSINNLNFKTDPFSVHISGISLTDFLAKVIVNPDGRLNLQNIVVEEEKTKEAQTTTQTHISQSTSKEQAQEKDIKIGNITLQGGTIEFIDKAIQPNYSATLTEIAGKVSDITLKGDKLAELNLQGKINQFVPLEIVGKINPARENLLVDVYARFNSLDLSPFTPYSGKYIGYKIEKGKLSIDLKYLIEKRKLDSQNVIFIDQLTLGESVDSPVAIKLPIRLAIALLKDRNGQIKLDIPVSGSLDDPKFSIWRIVLQIIVNLITKAVTAPFAFLGSLFGGGEEISYIEFDYGEYKISEANMKKIENLAKALYERPSLKLDIQGHVDVEKDRESLKKQSFLRKLKTQKLNEMIKKGEKAKPIDEITIETNEYNRYLKMAYDAETFAKPKTAIGTVKALPPEEMEKLIYTHIEVNDNDLRNLANQRANAVKEQLLKTGKVTVDRVFIIEPKTLAPEKKEKVKDSRVVFTIK